MTEETRPMCNGSKGEFRSLLSIVEDSRNLELFLNIKIFFFIFYLFFYLRAYKVKFGSAQILSQ